MHNNTLTALLFVATGCAGTVTLATEKSTIDGCRHLAYLEDTGNPAAFGGATAAARRGLLKKAEKIGATHMFVTKTRTQSAFGGDFLPGGTEIGGDAYACAAK